jgi:chemotaxis protein methyltransferase CheR
MNTTAILADAHFPELKRYVLGQTGLSYYADKNDDLAARLARRLEARHALDCDHYLRMLMGTAGAREMECLVGELTIGETYFFRQVEHFDVLRSSIFPSLLERNAKTRRIRVWSAGCATGEEPYSIAILLEREFGSALTGWNVSILASDINSEFLARAKEGRYGEWSLRATPHTIREQCFEQQGDAWILRPQYRKRVSFVQINLVADANLAMADMFDLVICRNVMIYFGSDLIHHTVTGFWNALHPGGWLIIGHAEFSSTVFNKFERVSVGESIVYRKPASDGAEPIAVAEPEAWTPPNIAVDALHPRRKTQHTSKPAQIVAVADPVAAATLKEVRNLADRGSWQAAAALGRKLIEAEPLSAAAHFTLGLILESVGSPEEAEFVLRRAIYLDRNFALAHYHLANCLRAGGKEMQARKSFQNVIQLLRNRPREEPVEHGDGMTVGDLKEMAGMHLRILGEREEAS